MYKLIPYVTVKSAMQSLIRSNESTIIQVVDKIQHEITPPANHDCKKPWAMYNDYTINYLLMYGHFRMDIHCLKSEKKASLIVTPSYIYKYDKLLVNRPCIVSIPTGIYHRTTSGIHGDLSLNIITRPKGLESTILRRKYDITI